MHGYNVTNPPVENGTTANVLASNSKQQWTHKDIFSIALIMDLHFTGIQIQSILLLVMGFITCDESFFELGCISSSRVRKARKVHYFLSYFSSLLDCISISFVCFFTTGSRGNIQLSMLCCFISRTEIPLEAPTALANDSNLTMKDLLDQGSNANTRKSTNRTNRSNPMYVEYKGTVYHIARFLSLIDGKIYCPAASRMERWKSSNQTSFFEQLNNNTSTIETNIKINDECCFLDTKSRQFIYGKVVRIIRRYGTKTAHPAGEAEISNLKNISFFVRCLSLSSNAPSPTLEPTKSITYQMFKG